MLAGLLTRIVCIRPAHCVINPSPLTGKSDIFMACNRHHVSFCVQPLMHAAGISKGGRAPQSDVGTPRSWTSETYTTTTLQSSSHWAAGA